MREVAIGIAVGRDSLIDLEHHDLLPRHLLLCKQCAHRPRRMAAAHRERELRVMGDCCARPGQDEGGCRVRNRISGVEDVEVMLHERQDCFSAWPPNSLRNAERILSRYSPRPRDSNRSMSAAVITGAGTPWSTAARTVQRPSPESDTRPANSSSSGDRAKASAVRSTSHDPTTEPRRQT